MPTELAVPPRGGSAARVAAGWPAALALAALGCAAAQLSRARVDLPARDGRRRPRRAPRRARDERYCAWYGAAASDDVLYFGQAAFWSAMARAGGDPTADLRQRRPAADRPLRPRRRALAAAARRRARPESRSGRLGRARGRRRRGLLHDVLRGGRIGEPATGRVRRLALGGALNELAEGPDGTVVATPLRLGRGRGDGDVIAFDRQGHTVRRWSLAAPPGYRVAPKTPLWDALRSELWVTADQLPDRADARRAAAPGRESPSTRRPRARWSRSRPSSCSRRRAATATLYRAEAEGSAAVAARRAAAGRGEPRADRARRRVRERARLRAGHPDRRRTAASR